MARNEWVTRDGRRIALAEMNDGHLLNALKLCRRQAEGLDGAYGDDSHGRSMGQDEHEEQVDDLADKISRLEIEVVRRGMELP